MYQHPRADPVRVTRTADDQGLPFSPDSLPQTFTYNADGTVAKVSATDGVSTWSRTFSYVNGQLSAASAWITGGGGWSPLDLGASLYDMWDAEDASKLALAGAVVSAWASSKNGYSAVQVTSGGKPTYGASSFNGRPGVTFDGADDELTYVGANIFPAGSAASEIWALVDQQAPASDITARFLMAYGGSGTLDRRGLSRTVLASTNRAAGSVGDGAVSNSVGGVTTDFTGRHVIRLEVGASQSRLSVDGAQGAPSSLTPATVATRLRLGANSSALAAGFMAGAFNMVAITAPLSTDQAAQMLAYLKTRGGIA